jgi:aminoglycoside 3'-phosphotransferase-1
LYLKYGHGSVAQDLADEMARMRWLARHASVPELRGFVATCDDAWLLMSAMTGRTAYDLLEAEPGQRSAIVEAIATHLRQLHALPIEECPFNSAHTLRLAAARSRMEAGEIDISDFDEEREGWTAEQVWAEMIALLPLVADPVVTHGDYSLDNILMKNGCVTGLVDLGRVGIADRYQDLAILANCLREFGDDLQELLFAAYGISQPDERKLKFHLMLDELF